jgi:hypothetical protein
VNSGRRARTAKDPKLALLEPMKKLTGGTRTESLTNVIDHLNKLREVAVFKGAGISKVLLKYREDITDSRGGQKRISLYRFRLTQRRAQGLSSRLGLEQKLLKPKDGNRRRRGQASINIVVRAAKNLKVEGLVDATLGDISNPE